MSDIKSKFIREYQRKSKSPWNDHSTILLLADYHIEDDSELELIFTRYIYQHRDSAGRILGISISKSILEEHTELESQYLTGTDMYIVLLLLKEDIATFCELFKEEFESVFGLPPELYLEAAEQLWAEKILVGDDTLVKGY
ncbi:hypothetical protein [uncultured Shewanella sp.]|uniref:hypothetical protein n=1 Tax=uncultured Shewanella sp. TaxID=173975 RepID=UPI002605C479|nr:hypothetical protein [uncultured Shewanella sp.]